MHTRRNILSILAAGAFAPAVQAHTMFNQWVVYRKKHLLIGSHRKDLTTYDLALEVVAAMDHSLPDASARAARAPHPERLASLLGTGQLELAVLSQSNAKMMRSGESIFTPYGALPLTLLANLGSHLFLAHRDFPIHHAWLVSAALNDAGLQNDAPVPSGEIETHPGTAAFHQRIPIQEL